MGRRTQDTGGFTTQMVARSTNIVSAAAPGSGTVLPGSPRKSATKKKKKKRRFKLSPLGELWKSVVPGLK